MTKRIRSVRDLNVYRLAFDTAMEIFTNLDEKYEHIIAQLNTMERKADSFCKTK